MRPAGRPVFAALYDRVAAPLEQAVLSAHRASLLSGLEGRVLDVGAGTGANLVHFGRATQVVAAEPDPWMRRRLAARVTTATVPVEVSSDTAEALSYDDASFDAVVCTCVLCTVGDPARALTEARRVLGPSGRLVLLEHVRGDGRLSAWQDRLTPLWAHLAGGCHPNRDAVTAAERAGFAFTSKEIFDPMPAWVPTRPWLKAVAHP
jgi:ubiquinone/menaquinone biosynthesis C-methylase UbiE